jgi:hypothetical protein
MWTSSPVKGASIEQNAAGARVRAALNDHLAQGDGSASRICWQLPRS